MAELVFRGAGQVIRNHRMALGLSLAELAAKAGTDKSQLAKFETNQVGISDARVMKLAKALDITPQKLTYEFLMTIKPELKSKPIGKLLSRLAESFDSPKPRKLKKTKLKAV